MDNPFFRLFYPNLRPDDPCPHMRTLVSDFASDALGGATLVYTRAHLAGCPRCTRALAALRDVQTRLHLLAAPAPPLDDARRADVTAAWDRIDERATW